MSHPRAAVREYLAHYHEERNHQGLAGQRILSPANLNRPGPIVCRERLGWAPALLLPRGGLKRPDQVFGHYGDNESDENVIESITLTYDFFELVQ